MITLTTIQLWIVNSPMISIHTHSTLTLCCCKTLARSLSNKFNSEFKQIEFWSEKQSKNCWGRAELQRELRQFRQNCESAKEWKSKVAANIQKQTSKSKHRDAKWEIKGSNPSLRSAEWLRSTRTTIMANKCDCTSFPPSQLFASPQQTHNCLLKPIRIQNSDFWFLSKIRVLHVMYKMDKIMRCDVHGVIRCWKSFHTLCGLSWLVEDWRRFCGLKFLKSFPSVLCCWNFLFVEFSVECCFSIVKVSS